MAILELQQVSKHFGEQHVVDNISINIEQGEFFTLLGPSGCGKTTLLRMIAGFCSPDSGKILLDGKDITDLAPEKRPLHTIFQSYALFPHLTVFDNVAFPLKMAKWSKERIMAQVAELLEDVQMSKFARRYPHELSGGQKQRVAIARSLVDRPKLLLLDEPLSALDARLREHMHVELVKLQEETGVTFVYVTHDQSEALALSSRIGVMNFGVIEQLDKPQNVYAQPGTYFVADFLGKCNLLEAKVLSITGNRLSLKVADSLEFELDVPEVADIKVGQSGWYALRPEKVCARRVDAVTATDSRFNITATVRGYYYYGGDTLYEFNLNNGVVLQALLGNTRTETAKFFNDGESVVVSFDIQAGNFLIR